LIGSGLRIEAEVEVQVKVKVEALLNSANPALDLYFTGQAHNDAGGWELKIATSHWCGTRNDGAGNSDSGLVQPRRSGMIIE
jgi:hypothetical protein